MDQPKFFYDFTVSTLGQVDATHGESTREGALAWFQNVNTRGISMQGATANIKRRAKPGSFVVDLAILLLTAKDPNNLTTEEQAQVDAEQLAFDYQAGLERN